jgi:hypothetical protein
MFSFLLIKIESLILFEVSFDICFELITQKLKLCKVNRNESRYKMDTLFAIWSMGSQKILWKKQVFECVIKFLFKCFLPINEN